MSARILDGKQLAGEIRARVITEIAAHRARHGPIRLCAVLVGNDEAARLYTESQRKRCIEAGLEYTLIELPADTPQAALLEQLRRLNADRNVHGIIVQLPLPPGIEQPAVQYHIDPYKDVEGVNPANIGMLFYDVPIIAPCTALAVNELIKLSGVEVRGANAVVIGQSRIVGRPISMFLTTQMATVTGCHIATRDLAAHARMADILVVAIGQPQAIGANYVKPGAVVIDVGINQVTRRHADGNYSFQTVGDVDFESVVEVAGAITPVPGGVGPVTVAILLRNTLEAARKQLTHAS
ncbi:MAG: bifunctional 5,10-methylenetetrahydrofolate dehydrogenase/5,10-methenyltetrahydrofolate cyclohydrolase [Deltaproteobacteria bacterium]|nr:bifunctional 5,10-methylenetetrahydrofolate dehydrogenase/5,10-methenyltetrahydrofolate cyclohydrolase [Deltaproteobacteria bacterium]